ncbi:MAG: molecular chaperone DnaK (HSP70), partial [Granulosicoccus sp.]
CINQLNVISEAVITVPKTFNDIQRQATKTQGALLS